MIPKRIHFTFTTLPDLPGKPFGLIHYLAVKSAAVVNRCEVICHCEQEPDGEYWQKARAYLRPMITRVPRHIAGIPLNHPAHRSDVLRLEILYREGGIYFDLDIISRRPVDDLLDNACVLGLESSKSVCTGVILAEAGSEFIRRWLEGYDPATSLTQGFRSRGMDQYWSEMSSHYAFLLARRHPELVRLINPHAFHFPFGNKEGHRMFHRRGGLPEDAYCHHLFESRNWVYLENLTEEQVRTTETNFCDVLRPLLD